MQGWRISMEDSHSVHLYLPPVTPDRHSKPSTVEIPEQPAGSTVTNDDEEEDGNALIGVFDGHGGSAVAKYTGTTFHTRLAELDSYKSGDYETALKRVFLKTDEDLRADPNFFSDPSGCTAVVGLVTKDGRIIVANAGDSRSVLGYRGEAKAMSNDHKPTNKEETTRITSAGGFVEFGRVNGNLALSRAIGDFEFKQNFSLSPERQIVTADPEIITHKIDGEEEFLVLACDGIWDCLSSQQVVDFTRRAIANGDSLGKICEDMMVKCLATNSETGGIGCDNMTVIVVALLNGRTPEEWQAWVKERVDKKIGHDTPDRIPDIFGQATQSSNIGGLTGAGFRVAGAGGLANIASILGASGITFKPSDDSDDDDDEELHIIGDGVPGPSGQGRMAFIDDKLLDDSDTPVDIVKASASRFKAVDADGDSTMDSDESDSTTTGVPTSPAPDTATPPLGESSPMPPAFTSIGSPQVPTHEELQTMKRQGIPSQLKSQPQGDAMSGAAKVEGLMDTSESPLKM
ncbi:phosphatase 2C-like domain-containing protein [Naematelia encephala]|uniref:protein-serine/threonine phosphatase n=1 Tax=Naematelia encephala TaxID=71784 RepID=A0A1Y2BBJ1_9TREE|nr:phosphatase 2C-like domain-containing protein [Naematelia encephala]